jgi:predicted DNA-binding transcriptional regulator AlpA
VQLGKRTPGGSTHGAGVVPSKMETYSKEAPRLLDMCALGAYLGRPWRSLERQLMNPPPGFPKPVRLGRRVFWSRDQVDAWLLGQPAPIAPEAEPLAALIAPLRVVPKAVKRGRGRPPKQPREGMSAGQGG